MTVLVREQVARRAMVDISTAWSSARQHRSISRGLSFHAQRAVGNRAVAAWLGHGPIHDQPARVKTEHAFRVAQLLDLQRLAGNAAVVRVTAGTGGGVTRSSTSAGTHVLQRAPAFGLAAPQTTNEFAKTAVRWWRRYPGTTLDNFAVILIEEASRFLEKIGVPAVERDDVASAGAAVFRSSTWTIGVNVRATGHAPNTKIGDLKPEDLADFANTVFHEARHAEQRFLMARLAVGKSPGKDAKAIANEVAVKESVAAAAITAGGGLSGAEKAKAEELWEFFDEHLGYKMWNNRLRDSASELVASLPSTSPSGVDSITTTWNAAAPKIDEWRKEAPWADTRIESLSKQTKRSAVDEQVLRDVRNTRKVLETAFEKATALATVVAEWPKMKARQTITLDVAKRVQAVFSLRWFEFELAARDVYLTAEGAYQRYPEEADSRAVGAAVTAATLREAKAARKP